jgi:hypothetical protein
MSDEITPYEADIAWLRMEFAKWWKLPTIHHEEMFCELVAKMVQDDEFTENEARKIAFDRIVYE